MLICLIGALALCTVFTIGHEHQCYRITGFNQVLAKQFLNSHSLGTSNVLLQQSTLVLIFTKGQHCYQLLMLD